MKNFSRERNLYTTFMCLNLAALYLRRDPKPGLKLPTAYFTRKEIMRLYINVFARSNGPNKVSVIFQIFIAGGGWAVCFESM